MNFREAGCWKGLPRRSPSELNSSLPLRIPLTALLHFRFSALLPEEASASAQNTPLHNPSKSRSGSDCLSLAKVEKIASGMRWSEGPVWFGDGRYLLWSNIPNNRIMKWEEETGAVSVFRKPSNNSNGNTRDRQGRLLTCEHDARRVTRTEYDGSITVIAESYQGKPLNSPNDVVYKSDGSIWFTDPPFGILGFYEGHKAKVELPTNVYRWDPNSEKVTVVAGNINRPIGTGCSCAVALRCIRYS